LITEELSKQVLFLKFRFGDQRRNQVISFSGIIPDLMEEFNLNDSFLIETLAEKWSQYVGNILSSHSSPDRIFKKILFIKVDHSAYSNELSMHQDNIVKKIKDDFGSDFINSIRFEVKKSRWNKNR